MKPVEKDIVTTKQRIPRNEAKKEQALVRSVCVCVCVCVPGICWDANYKAFFLMKQQWSRWDFGCPHHLL